MGWLSTIWGVIKVIAGLISGTSSTPDPTVAERKAGEDLGKAETIAAQAQGEIENVAVANKVRADTAAAAARDPGSLRQPDPWSRD